ncbi:MAG: Hpt domain-containing protein, partial [Gammaproteobacteria bacterium]|nr:Hpt domain-containing protein [Gammaproteobacteria bacterium]
MNPDNTVEYNSLNWVKTQLDDVLSDAQSCLNEYIENNAAGELENCIEHLQLIYGTLQMVEVYGAAMLAEEMQLTSSALLAGNIERAEDTYDVLMRAMLQLPDYLEGIQAGKKDAPIILMPLFNDLRAARKEGLLSESVLFLPELENTRLNSERYDTSVIEPGKLQEETKRLRIHYQLGLLDFIRNNKEHVGLQRMKAVLRSLEIVSSDKEVRHVWMIVGALVEGLMKQGIDTNLSIKMLLAAVDRQLKFILDNGEDDYANNYSKDLIKNVLYYVGLSTVNTKSIAAVKEAYNLDELIQQEDDESASIGGLNADLFGTVSIGITEDLEKVKDTLELFMYSNDKDVTQLTSVAEQLGKIADTYGMLGMGEARHLIMAQRTIIESMVEGSVEINDDVVMDIASNLLNVEAELKDYIDSRSGAADLNINKGEQNIPAAEYRQVVHTVVAEGLNNFSLAKEAILSYVTGIGDKGQLETILLRLEEVRGVSMMLHLDRVEILIEKLKHFVQVALVDNDHKATESEQDSIADVFVSIEYFFEAISEGRPGVEQGLTAGYAAVEKLQKIVESYGDPGNQHNLIEITPEQESELQIDALNVDEQTSLKKNSAEAVVEQPVVEETAPDDIDVTQYSILSDDADEEIVEIFIEEAIDVLGELHEHFPQWKVNNDDEESLAVIRRGFHTLKGSGRLLGADMIGEFSWKFENVLNRFIDNKITVSDDLFNVFDEALAVLPQLIEQLKGNREPIENIGQLMASADALAEGKMVSPVSVEASDTETIITETITTEAITIEEDDVEVIDTDIAMEFATDNTVEIEQNLDLEVGDEQLNPSELSHDEYVFLDSLSADLVVIEDDVFAAEDVIEETVVLDVAEEVESAEEEIILFEETDITLENEQQLFNEESPAKEENAVEEIIEKSDANEITQTATNDDSYTGDFEIIID